MQVNLLGVFPSKTNSTSQKYLIALKSHPFVPNPSRPSSSRPTWLLGQKQMGPILVNFIFIITKIMTCSFVHSALIELSVCKWSSWRLYSHADCGSSKGHTKCLRRARGWGREGKKNGSEAPVCRLVSSGLRSTRLEQKPLGCSQPPHRRSRRQVRRGARKRKVSRSGLSFRQNYKTSEASLYSTELFTIEISQSTVLSEKISESQWLKSPDRVKQLLGVSLHILQMSIIFKTKKTQKNKNLFPQRNTELQYY